MKQDLNDWSFNVFITGIGNEEETKDRLFNALKQEHIEIRDKDRNKYSVKELITMLEKGRKNGR